MEGGAPQDGLRVPVAEGDVLELYVHPSPRGRQRQRTRRILPPPTHTSFMQASPRPQSSAALGPPRLQPSFRHFLYFIENPGIVLNLHLTFWNLHLPHLCAFGCDAFASSPLSYRKVALEFHARHVLAGGPAQLSCLSDAKAGCAQRKFSIPELQVDRTCHELQNSENSLARSCTACVGACAGE